MMTRAVVRSAISQLVRRCPRAPFHILIYTTLVCRSALQTCIAPRTLHALLHALCTPHPLQIPYQSVARMGKIPETQRTGTTNRQNSETQQIGRTNWRSRLNSAADMGGGGCFTRAKAHLGHLIRASLAGGVTVHHLLCDTGRFMSFYICCFRLTPRSVFTARKETRPWSPGIRCPPLIKLFCGTSTLMLGRVQFATCVFALYAPVRSLATVLQAHHQRPTQWILGCRCLCLLVPIKLTTPRPVM